jgi:hypothetical protein
MESRLEYLLPDKEQFLRKGEKGFMMDSNKWGKFAGISVKTIFTKGPSICLGTCRVFTKGIFGIPRKMEYYFDSVEFMAISQSIWNDGVKRKYVNLCWRSSGNTPAIVWKIV